MPEPSPFRYLELEGIPVGEVAPETMGDYACPTFTVTFKGRRAKPSRTRWGCALPMKNGRVVVVSKCKNPRRNLVLVSRMCYQEAINAIKDSTLPYYLSPVFYDPLMQVVVMERIER